MYWKVELACRGRMCSIVLTLVPFGLGSSALIFVIQIIPEGEEKRNKKLQIDFKIPERLRLVGNELEGKC